MAESAAGLLTWSETITIENTAVKLIGVYSPVKRCLQTSLALSDTGNALAKFQPLRPGHLPHAGVGLHGEGTFPCDPKAGRVAGIDRRSRNHGNYDQRAGSYISGKGRAAVSERT